MANSNFVVQNGLEVGTLTIFAGNGDITTSGNISVTGGGSFGGLSSNKVYQGSSNVNVASTEVTIGIAGAGNVATFNSSGLTVSNITVTGTETVNNTEYATTLIATTVNAATIGNTGATITGTNSTLTNLSSTTAVATNFSTSNAQITSGNATTFVATNLSSGNIQATSNITLTGSIIPSSNVSSNLGDSTHWFNTFYGISTQAKYADLAENYQADKPYNPGTVLMFGGTQEVTLAEAVTTRVAGVVSTNPAHLMNGQLTGAGVVALALTGRVPCNVIGPVKKGDLMVSAGFGFAKADNAPAVGTVIGKALEDFGVAAKGVIEVVVGRF